MTTPSNMPPELPEGIAWHDQTLAWWGRLTADPPADIDWDFAVETALIHTNMWSGDLGSLTELRKRLDRLSVRKRQWGSQDSKTLTQLHAEGRSLTQISAMTDWPKVTVSRRAKELGLMWDRSQTAAATAAKIEDGRAARAQAALDELAILQTMQSQVLKVYRGEERWQTTIRGDSGMDKIVYLEFIPPRDADTIARARQSASSTIDRLNAGLSNRDEHVMSLVDGISAKLGLDDNKEPDDGSTGRETTPVNQ